MEGGQAAVEMGAGEGEGGVGMIAGVGLWVCDENNERCPRVCVFFGVFFYPLLLFRLRRKFK